MLLRNVESRDKTGRKGDEDSSVKTMRSVASSFYLLRGLRLQQSIQSCF